MTRLIRISPNIAYTQNDIESLLELIHFKYFDVKKVDEFYEITYNNIIVEEVLKEIYYSFIYDNQNVYEKLLNYDVIKGGGKGCCFEEIVVKNLSPSYLNDNFTIPYLNIKEREKIPKFLPKINENTLPFINEKIKLENKTYIIEQEIFGGKNIDFIIIDIIGKDQYIFAFQVSIFKDEIFSIDNIKNILKNMYEYLKNFFTNLNVKKENIYFGYVFFISE